MLRSLVTTAARAGRERADEVLEIIGLQGRAGAQAGLLAHGELPPGYSAPADVTCRTLNEISLGLLVAEAQKRREVFWG